MLILIHNISQLAYGQLMSVYEESIQNDAQKYYAGMDKNIALLNAQQDLYNYLKTVFFRNKGATIAVWVNEGRYASILRYESYDDGFLITALETAPNERRKGFAGKLLSCVISKLASENCLPIYSHIDCGNTASLACHSRCGFRIKHQKAIFLDDSMHPECCTMVYDLKDTE